MRSYNEQIITLTYSCTRFGVLSRLSRLSRNSVEEANNASDRKGGRESRREGADHVNGQANVPREPEINLTWDVALAFVSLSLSLCDDSELWPSGTSSWTGCALSATVASMSHPCLSLSKVSCTCHKAH